MGVSSLQSCWRVPTRSGRRSPQPSRDEAAGPPPGGSGPCRGSAGPLRLVPGRHRRAPRAARAIGLGIGVAVVVEEARVASIEGP